MKPISKPFFETILVLMFDQLKNRKPYSRYFDKEFEKSEVYNFDEEKYNASQPEIFNKLFKGILNFNDTKKGTISKYMNSFSKTIYNALANADNRKQLLGNYRSILNEYFLLSEIKAIVDECNKELRKPNNSILVDDSKLATQNDDKDKQIAFLVKMVNCGLDTYFNKTETCNIFRSMQFKIYDWFTGRDKEMNRIESSLNEHRYAFLHGMDGLGKTQLAKHYIAVHKDDYDLVLFTTFDTNLTESIRNIHCDCDYKYNDPTKLLEIKKQAINEIGKRAIILIDGMNDIPSDSEKLDIDNMVKDYNCHFIFTSHLNPEYTYFENGIEVKELTKEQLLGIIKYQISKRKHIIQTIEDNADDIMNALYYNTFLAELVGKQLDRRTDDPLDYFSNLIKDDRDYGNRQLFSNISNDQKIETIRQKLEKLYSIEGIPEELANLLCLFTTFPNDSVINNDIIMEWMGEDAQDHLDRLTDLGWINCEYSKEKDYYEYGIHPLLSDVLYQKYQPSAEKYTTEIVNIDAFVTQIFRYGTSYLYPIVHSIAMKMKGTSQGWERCKSKICLWLCHNNAINKAYEIYRTTANKFEFVPELYQHLQVYAPEDDTIIKALKEHQNYFRLKADSKEAYQKLFTTNDPTPPIAYHTLNDVEFISVHEALVSCLKTANNKINEFCYYELNHSLYIFQNTIYKYRSFDTVNETPRLIDSDTFLDFIQKQIKCKTIEETDIYKTYLKCCTNEEQTQRLTMFNNLNILRDTLMKAAFITYVTDFWCGSPNSSMSYFEIARRFEAFISTNSRYTNRDTLLLWKIQLGYMYIQCCGFADSGRVLKECKNIKGINDFFLQMQLEICEYYQTSVKLLWQHEHTYPIATP